MLKGVRIAIGIAAIVGAVAAGLAVDEWFDIDSCLDGGGAWDYSRGTCRFHDR
jgi:hypothetical protein